MAETDEVQQDVSVNLSSIIKEQSQTIETLVSQVKEGTSQTAQPSSPIYWYSETAKTAKAPNYFLYLMFGLGAYFLFFKKRG